MDQKQFDINASEIERFGKAIPICKLKLLTRTLNSKFFSKCTMTFSYDT